MSSWRVLVGDCRETMRALPDASVHCCVTSPPYWGLRDYGHDGQLGLERTPGEYVAKLVDVFREVRRVMRDDGTLWLNLGDSYAASGRGGNPVDSPFQKQGTHTRDGILGRRGGRIAPDGYKQEDLVGIPWRVAFALQADGWYLRSDIIWSKPNPMPESVRDRPTKAHEYIFLLSKNERYYYDADAIAESLTTDPSENYANRAKIIGRGGLESLEQSGAPQQRTSGGFPPRTGTRKGDASPRNDGNPWNSNNGRGFPFDGETRNRRSVWTIATQPYSGAHFATFPTELVEPCILAGCPSGGTVLDPFAGSGTTAVVATGHGRHAILCELNPEYVHLIRERCGALLEVA